ncbi:unnamed protein product [Amoebophrya sp. A25]|nr:unnamed protein product [Amoebophrya sp. A25]|eukprot:GSA25T00005250001.1
MSFSFTNFDWHGYLVYTEAAHKSSNLLQSSQNFFD